MEQIFYKNVNTNEVWTKEEYLELLDRETKNEWEHMDDEEKAEKWNNDFNKFYEDWTIYDGDFVECDENGDKNWRAYWWDGEY